MHNFLITGMGRSGTRFLAETMNLSKKWTVMHEPGGPGDLRRRAEEIQKRLDRDYYGEVNSLLRFVSDELKVEKRGLILRSPVDLWFSITTWHARQKHRWPGDLADMKRTIPHLLDLALSGHYRPIFFESMISSDFYLQNILADFGIDDVEITPEILKKKINQNLPGVRRTAWKDFNVETRLEIQRLAGMYATRLE